MINSDAWLQTAANKLAANAFQPLDAENYQAQGYKYAVRRSRFEISKFGIAENFFTFAEIPNLTLEMLRNYSTAAFNFANANRTAPLPNGFFAATFCYAVAITANLDPQIGTYIRETQPAAHWSAFELSVIFDLANGTLHYYEKTPLWGAAYYKGFRREIQANLA